MLHRPQLPSTSFHHIQSLLNVLVCYFESVTCKRNTPTGEQFIFLCCPNARTFSHRSRARQTTDVDTLRFCLSAECKRSPFHFICPNMLPYSVAWCREAFLRSSGHLATRQAKCSSTPKMSSSLSLKAIFFWQPWHSCSQLIIDAHVGRKKWTILLLIVQFYCCFKPAAVLSEVLEFQPSPTLFSKSYYPRWSPAASGILYKLCQLTSVPSPLHEEFSALQRSGQFFLISSQKIRTWREQDERNNSKDFDLDSRRPETLKLTRIYTIRPLMAAGQRWFLDVWEGQLTSWRCWGR